MKILIVILFLTNFVFMPLAQAGTGTEEKDRVVRFGEEVTGVQAGVSFDQNWLEGLSEGKIKLRMHLKNNSVQVRYRLAYGTTGGVAVFTGTGHARKLIIGDSDLPLDGGVFAVDFPPSTTVSFEVTLYSAAAMEALRSGNMSLACRVMKPRASDAAEDRRSYEVCSPVIALPSLPAK
jgi:hypothetical protein